MRVYCLLEMFGSLSPFAVTWHFLDSTYSLSVSLFGLLASLYSGKPLTERVLFINQ